MSKLARFKVSNELFRKLLCLPDTTEIVSVGEPMGDYFSVIVRSPDLPEIQPKDGVYTIPEISPRFERTAEGTSLKDWGFQE